MSKNKLIIIILLSVAVAAVITLVILFSVYSSKKASPEDSTTQEEEENNNGDEDKYKYEVIFDANGGVFADGKTTLVVKVEEDGHLTDPEHPTLEGYGVVGWTLEKDGDVRWDFENDTVSENLTLYAEWSNKAYYIFLESDDDDKGKVEFNRKSFIAGTSVKLEAKPFGGYAPEGWYDKNTDRRLSSESVYKFYMPEGNLSLVVKYKIDDAMEGFEFDSSNEYGCKITNVPNNITEWTIPGYVNSISPSAIKPDSKLEKIVMGSGMYAIGVDAFTNCKNLTTFEIGSNVEKIGQGAFYSCTNLKSVTFSDSVKEIGTSAFYGTGLEEVVLNDGLERIGEEAFAACENLKKITLSKSLKWMGARAVTRSNSLEEVVFTDGHSWMAVKRESDTSGYVFESSELQKASDAKDYLQGKKKHAGSGVDCSELGWKVLIPS